MTTERASDATCSPLPNGGRGPADSVAAQSEVESSDFACILPDIDDSGPAGVPQQKNAERARGPCRHLSPDENELKTNIGAFRTVERALLKYGLRDLGDDQEQLECEAIEQSLQSENQRIRKAGLTTLQLRLDRHTRLRSKAHRLMVDLYIAQLKETTKLVKAVWRTKTSTGSSVTNDSPLQCDCLREIAELRKLCEELLHP